MTAAGWGLPEGQRCPCKLAQSQGQRPGGGGGGSRAQAGSEGNGGVPLQKGPLSYRPLSQLKRDALLETELTSSTDSCLSRKESESGKSGMSVTRPDLQASEDSTRSTVVEGWQRTVRMPLSAQGRTHPLQEPALSRPSVGRSCVLWCPPVGLCVHEHRLAMGFTHILTLCFFSSPCISLSVQ